MADNIQSFIKELAFEEALTNHLLGHGWNEVMMNPTEEQLVENWAHIIYDNNREIDKLGNHPLTASEMQQVMDKVNMVGSPYEMNRFINAQEVCIKRDNEADTNNCGKEVYLKIFDPMEISSGQSRYQIARQPKFKTADEMGGDRRGDVMLLINGMPVIHIELKRSKVDVSQACFQIKRYVHEGVFQSGIFSMVQIYVAMTPEETLYFANPGTEDRFHYAITGQTAAEIVYTKADHTKEHMGLTTWKNAPDGRILKSDVSIAKNYLQEKEIRQLERAVTGFFDYIEDLIERENTFNMEQFSASVNEFLAFRRYQILPDKGKISAAEAKQKAENEYDIFNRTQRIDSDFDKGIRGVLGNK